MEVTVDLIVNPASGPPSRDVARTQRLAHASRRLLALGHAPVRAFETQRPGDGRAAAARAVADGVDVVIAWGGDGTINEVASALVGTSTALGIVPGGSGNGLARALGLPLGIDAALTTAVHGSTMAIDVGTADSTPYFNIAGFGIDAAIAARFNRMGGLRRGLVTYMRACVAELGAYAPSRFRVSLDGRDWFAGHAHTVAVANGQQYGHGARIAPHARLDDGWLDVVVVPDITRWRVVRHGWRLFAGSIDRVPGVRCGRARQVEVVPEGTCLLHLDGETQQVTHGMSLGIRPRALRVRVPAGGAIGAQRG